MSANKYVSAPHTATITLRQQMHEHKRKPRKTARIQGNSQAKPSNKHHKVGQRTTTDTRDRSPASSVGVTNVKHGFSIPARKRMTRVQDIHRQCQLYDTSPDGNEQEKRLMRQ